MGICRKINKTNQTHTRTRPTHTCAYTIYRHNTRMPFKSHTAKSTPDRHQTKPIGVYFSCRSIVGPILQRVDINRNLFAININRNYVHKIWDTANLRLIRGLAIDSDQSLLFVRRVFKYP